MKIAGEKIEKQNDDQDFPPTEFMSRLQWGAKSPKFIESLELPVAKVVISYTETPRCNTKDECIQVVRTLQKAHMAEKDVPDIKHNFLIGGDGTVYEGRGYTRVGPIYSPSPKRIELLNHSSINIGVIGPRSRIIGDVMRGVTTCVSRGMEGNFLDIDFETFYIVDNEIIYIHSDKMIRLKKMQERSPD